nr:hypothetical protein [Tanacetum cinerariifolium]
MAILVQTRIGIKPQQPEEPESTLEDEFQDFHLNLPVLEVLAHASIYNAILDKYVESLELGKNGSAFIQGIKPQQPEEPESTLEDEFQDFHLNLPVLEVLAHASIYNAILDKYIESLELGNNGSAFIQGEVPVKIEDPRLFTLPCRLGDSKPFDTLADLRSCVNIIPLYHFKKLNIGPVL